MGMRIGTHLRAPTLDTENLSETQKMDLLNALPLIFPGLSVP